MVHCIGSLEIKYFWKEFGKRIRVKNLKVQGWKIDVTNLDINCEFEIGNWNEQKQKKWR